MAFEADTEIFRIRESRHCRDFGDRVVRFPQQLAGTLQPDVQYKLFYGHSSQVINFLVQTGPADGHIGHKVVHTIVFVLKILLNEIDSFLQQFRIDL